MGTNQDVTRNAQLQQVAKLLQTNWNGTEDWGEISHFADKPCPKKVANKFLLCCLLDYQIKADVAWKNGESLVREMGDPDDIWEAITSFTKEEWKSKFKELHLHRFPNAHDRLWRIGRDIRARYDGDARNLWQGKEAVEVLYRLQDIGAGEQISRMIVGALRDVRQIKGIGDVKADVHVCRVLGRVFFGEQTHPGAATELARDLAPQDPWRMDWPLWNIGSSTCHLTAPDCPKCDLAPYCSYAQKRISAQ